VATNSNNVFAEATHNKIIRKLNGIKRMLKDQVIPTLEECCGYIVAIPKTGQTTSYATGDDSDLQMGIPWPDPRFTDNSDGTVTGLMWTKNAQEIVGTIGWYAGLAICDSLVFGGYDDW